jgi:hypothetical protein
MESDIVESTALANDRDKCLSIANTVISSSFHKRRRIIYCLSDKWSFEVIKYTVFILYLQQ